MSLMTVLRGKGLRCSTFRRKAFMPFANEVCLPIPAVFTQDAAGNVIPGSLTIRIRVFLMISARINFREVPSKPHS